MPAPLLVIELGEGRAAGAVFALSGGGPLASATVRMPAGPEGLKSAVGELLEELCAGLGVAAPPKGGASGYSGVFKDVYLSLPPAAPSLRVLDIPFTDRTRIREVLGYELQGLLPYDAKEAVADGMAIEGGRVLAVAIEKQSLAGYLGALKSFGLDPVWAGLSGLCVPGYIEGLLKPPGAIGYVSADFISVQRGGRTVFFNTFSDPEGLRLSLEYLAAEGMRVDVFFCQEGSREALSALAGPGVRVEVLSLPDGVPGGLVTALALTGAVKDGRIGEAIDLRTGEFEYTEIKARAKRRLMVTLALVCALAALLLGDLYVRYLSYSGVLAAYSSAIASEYVKLFPGERASAGGPDPVYLLNARMKALEGEARVAGGGINALGLLKALSTAAASAPELKIRLFDVIAADGRISARGEGASFEAANRFREILDAEPAFTNVLLSEVKAGTTGAVSFSLSAGI